MSLIHYLAFDQSLKIFAGTGDGAIKITAHGIAGLPSTFTLTDFFQLYENLFESISKEGDIQSHRYILNKTAEYLGVNINETTDIQALLDEITSLRNELLDTNKTLLDLNKK